MGNAFTCSELFQDIKLNICYQNQCSEKEDQQILVNIQNYDNNKNNNTNKNQYEKKINELKKYFNKNGNEIVNNFNKKQKSKKYLSKKKHINALNKLSDNKYELMLKRLLEQKSIKREGPKRRETIRNEKNIKIFVNEIISENLNEIKNHQNNNNKIEIKDNQENNLLIKNINIKKLRSSCISEKVESIQNNLYLNKNKNIYNFHQRNTINEIINESSGYSALYKKKTTQSNSPEHKKH